MRYLIIIFLVFKINSSYAQKYGAVTGYEIPRFVSIKSSEVNLRIGPSINYPIKIKYTIKNFPVEIIDEYDVWRKIQDIEKNEGWIHKSLLKGDRYGIINSEPNVESFLLNYPHGNIKGEIGNNNIVKISKCLKKWCLVKIDNKSGWIEKNKLWGTYNNEIYKISFIQPLIDSYWKILQYLK